MKKLLQDYRKSVLGFFVLFFLATLAFGYDISSYNFQDYNRTCRANNQTAQSYNDCMKPYYDQYRISFPGTYISGGLTVITLIMLLNSLPALVNLGKK